MVRQMYHEQRGHITLVTGPMFSGKTTELLRLHGRQQLAGKRCVLVKYAKDTRYDENLIATHDKHKSLSNTIKANELQEVYGEMFDEAVDVVAIDEGQFFSDLADTCERLMRARKIVIVAALNARFDRKAFEQVALLQPNANEITLLTAVCDCGENAIFTHRKSAATEEELIGGKEVYKACCRECYYKAESEMHDGENIYPKKMVDDFFMTSTRLHISPEKKPRLDGRPLSPRTASKNGH